MSITLIKGDCLEKMKDISDCSIDLIICDLPYGCLADNRKKQPDIRRADNGKPLNRMNFRITGCSWDIKLNLEAFWKEIKRIRKSDNTPCIHFCNTKFGYDLIQSNPKEFRYDLVWSKSNAVGFLNANKKPMSSHEMIYVFSKTGSYYQRIDIEGDFPAGGGGTSTATFLPIAGMPNTSTTVAGKRCVKSVVEIANKKTKGGHPTEKPMQLYKWLIERYCPPGGTVLDPTAGSFNSCFASYELDRNSIGIEKDTNFYDKACKRADSL